MFQIGPFSADNVSKQLILQTISGDSEIDQRSLRLHFRFVMRVCQLRLQNQPKQM